MQNGGHVTYYRDLVQTGCLSNVVLTIKNGWDRKTACRLQLRSFSSGKQHCRVCAEAYRDSHSTCRRNSCWWNDSGLFTLYTSIPSLYKQQQQYHALTATETGCLPSPELAQAAFQDTRVEASLRFSQQNRGILSRGSRVITCMRPCPRTPSVWGKADYNHGLNH